jgi:uncharacterized protein YndB with AHSA1/START domain
MRIWITSLLALCLLGTAAHATERAVEKEVVIDATVDQAWDAWTTREGITSFFAPDAKIEPHVGGAFQIYINPLAESGMKGADDMHFMALQPKKMLSFDWNAPPSLAEARKQRTFVIVRFEPVSEKQTRVSIHHTGWGDGGEWDKAYVYFDRAWVNVLGSLKKRFENGPMDWTEWMNRMRKFQEEAAQKK